MSEIIEQLKEAVSISPENIPLRLHLADRMVAEGWYDEAALQFNEVLARNYGNPAARKGLIRVYEKQKKFSAASIIYEDLMNDDLLTWEELVHYARSLVREESFNEAANVYQKVIALNPDFQDAELDGLFRQPSAGFGGFEEDGEDDEGYSYSARMPEADFFMEKPDISFKDVGGMERIKNEISLKIIQPLNNPELYKAFGKKTGGGILMYGPPGCGKTFLAKATAGEINAKFLSIGLHDILDMWMGNSEKNLHAVFEQARANTPCVLFFDEADALGASRSELRQSSMKHVINQFLAEMDGVASNNEGILILAATNAPWSIDPAFRRPGRFDRVIFVAPPDEDGRKQILDNYLDGKPVERVNTSTIARMTEGFSGADLKALVENAAEKKLEESLAKGVLQKITEKDLVQLAKQQAATTSEWFSTARNYALYSNESGQYNDILDYLKIRK